MVLNDSQDTPPVVASSGIVAEWKVEPDDGL